MSCQMDEDPCHPAQHFPSLPEVTGVQERHMIPGKDEASFLRQESFLQCSVAASARYKNF